MRFCIPLAMGPVCASEAFPVDLTGSESYADPFATQAEVDAALTEENMAQGVMVQGILETWFPTWSCPGCDASQPGCEEYIRPIDPPFKVDTFVYRKPNGDWWGGWDFTGSLTAGCDVCPD